MHDPVNSPEHYTHGGLETIDIVEAWGFGRGFCFGNAIKYLCRAAHKGNEIQDLEKALWYLKRAANFKFADHREPIHPADARDKKGLSAAVFLVLQDIFDFRFDDAVKHLEKHIKEIKNV